MAYKFSARHPGRLVTYTEQTEESALARWEALTADGVDFDLTDASGAEVDDIDLEDRINARG